jgi:hypothetical protein
MAYTSLKNFSDVEHVKTDTTEKLLHAGPPKYTAFNIYTRNDQNPALMPLHVTHNTTAETSEKIYAI